MYKEEVLGKVKPIVEQLLSEQGLVLFDLTFRREGRDLILRILTDRSRGGITLDECSSLNNQIGLLLEENNIIQDRYILEVSSPGIDRPLREKKDFLRSKGGLVRFFLKEPFLGKLEIVGKIDEVKDETLILEIDSSKKELPISIISKGKPIVVEKI